MTLCSLCEITDRQAVLRVECGSCQYREVARRRCKNNSRKHLGCHSGGWGDEPKQTTPRYGNCDLFSLGNSAHGPSSPSNTLGVFRRKFPSSYILVVTVQVDADPFELRIYDIYCSLRREANLFIHPACSCWAVMIYCNLANSKRIGNQQGVED